MQQFFNTLSPETLEPALYIISTPIGNIKDITIRGLGVIKSCEYFFCEDTRVTKGLFEIYGIKNKKFFVYNDYSNDATRQNILKLIQEDNAVALVSDAGTPLISDPGFKLVRFLKNNGKKVISIGGISAFTTALSCSGISSDRFEFFGFLPTKCGDKTEKLREILNKDISVICYESPNRLLNTLKLIKDMDNNRIICVARELTKMFETVITNTVEYLFDYYNNHKDELRGEIVLLIEKNTKIKTLDLVNFNSILRESLKYMSVKNSAEFLSGVFNWNKKEVYNTLLTLGKE
ncbi:MAG: 16S rRNA (cytidine(1402)-2'-O)-methyltransferase [Rickettsiales bacterium]|jgi:16S rRNA (cytidine1402-2'-O)-methyltransferase|nr:16S rRNA (cytidine(1402)-2'-O)-methyltransferase [Rickettsiales bacterium]